MPAADVVAANTAIAADTSAVSIDITTTDGNTLRLAPTAVAAPGAAEAATAEAAAVAEGRATDATVKKGKKAKVLKVKKEKKGKKRKSAKKVKAGKAPKKSKTLKVGKQVIFKTTASTGVSASAKTGLTLLVLVGGLLFVVGVAAFAMRIKKRAAYEPIDTRRA